MAVPKIALVGAGQMGSNHARIITESSSAELGIVIDSNGGFARRLADQYGTRSSTQLADAMQVDGVVVASSTADHMQCALPFLQAGIPTFIEKPLAPRLGDVDKLIETAERGDTPIMCGFVERFNAAFHTALNILQETPTHVLTVRHSPPAPRIASSVVSDMLLHDIDLVTTLFGGATGKLRSATCYVPSNSQWAEIADCTVVFSGSVVSMSASRMGQRKVRMLTIYTTTDLLEIDLLRNDVTVYRNVSQEMTDSDGGRGYRSSTEIDIPFVRHVAEPLSAQFDYFLELVNGRGDHNSERLRIRPPHALTDAIEAGGAITTSM